jgi:hypothetical protein
MAIETVRDGFVILQHAKFCNRRRGVCGVSEGSGEAVETGVIRKSIFEILAA